MEQDKKFALLIDAENISPQYIDIILSEANNLGNVIYKRIYGNWTSPQMGSWKSTILDNAIQPVQQYSNTSGKNSSDSALIIDTMDLLYRTQLDGFCIVSSDSDFTRLASRLRESDKYVLGMGRARRRAPLSLLAIGSCILTSFMQNQNGKICLRPNRQRFRKNLLNQEITQKPAKRFRKAIKKCGLSAVP